MIQRILAILQQQIVLTLLLCKSSPTRAAIFHSDTATPNVVNTIDYVEIMTTGNAIDFGDMNTNTIWGRGGSSNGHGGLG